MRRRWCACGGLGGAIHLLSRGSGTRSSRICLFRGPFVRRSSIGCNPVGFGYCWKALKSVYWQGFGILLDLGEACRLREGRLCKMYLEDHEQDVVGVRKAHRSSRNRFLHI